MPISENDALFTLIGTTYGGDGQETFGIPDLRGRLPMHQGPLSQLGEMAGVEDVTLTTQTMPQHNHPALAANSAGDASAPGNTTILANEGPAGIDTVFTWLPTGSGGVQTPMLPTAITFAGGQGPHTNIQPTLGINYIISLFGIFPQQS